MHDHTVSDELLCTYVCFGYRPYTHICCLLATLRFFGAVHKLLNLSDGGVTLPVNLWTIKMKTEPTDLQPKHDT